MGQINRCCHVSHVIIPWQVVSAEISLAWEALAARLQACSHSWVEVLLPPGSARLPAQVACLPACCLPCSISFGRREGKGSREKGQEGSWGWVNRGSNRSPQGCFGMAGRLFKACPGMDSLGSCQPHPPGIPAGLSCLQSRGAKVCRLPCSPAHPTMAPPPPPGGGEGSKAGSTSEACAVTVSFLPSFSTLPSPSSFPSPACLLLLFFFFFPSLPSHKVVSKWHTMHRLWIMPSVCSIMR